MKPTGGRTGPTRFERSKPVEADSWVGPVMFLVAVALVLLFSFFCAGVAFQWMGWGAVGVVYVATVVLLFLPVATGGFSGAPGKSLFALAWRVPVVWLAATVSITALGLAGPPVVCAVGTPFVLAS